MRFYPWVALIAFAMCHSSVLSLDKDVIPGRKYSDSFIKKYTSSRMMMYCYGKGRVHKWQNRIERHWYDCEQLERPFAPNETKHYEPFPFPLYPFFGHRRVSALKYETVMGIKILQCVFDRMDIKLNSKGAVVAHPMHQYFKKIKGVGKRLKGYLNDGIKMCSELVECGTSYDEFGSKYANFMKLLAFYRCEMYNRLTSCIRYDMDRHRKEFRVTAVIDLLKGLDDSSRRLAISTYYANSHLRGPFKVLV